MGVSVLACPSCGCAALNLVDYESLIVVAEGHALFTVKCPDCGSSVSTLRPIPQKLRDEVRFAAMEVGAGMGRVG